MPSDAKKKRDQAKKAAAKGGKKSAAKSETNGITLNIEGNLLIRIVFIYFLYLLKFLEEIDAATAAIRNVELENAKARSVAAVLTSHPQSVNLKVDQLTITFHGRELVNDTTLEINMGRRYGLIGLNGSGNF